MLNIEQEIKELYRSDSIAKNLILEFYHDGDTEPFLSLQDGHGMKGESMKLTESLCTGKNLDFGSCDAAQFEITLLDIEDNIKGATLIVHHELEGGHMIPLGKYIVESADRQADQKYRSMVALDFMRKFDTNVIEWYRSLTFPLSLKNFRASLCQYIGVAEHVPDDLLNDSVMVEQTINTEELTGRTVLKACEQLNGAFGHFDRNGILQHVRLKQGLLNEDGAPDVDEDILQYLCKNCRFEEYSVKSIEKVQVRQEEGDIGAIYGTGENTYTVDGNFITFGKNAEELDGIARNIYNAVSGISYIPFASETKGLPYLEPGDSVFMSTEYGDVASYIMKRTLKGTTAMKDSYSATGEETRRTETNINTELIQLKGRYALIKKTVEEVSVTVGNLEEETEAALSVMTGIISLKVNRGDVSSELSLEPDKVYLRGNRLVIESENFTLDENGNGEFSGLIKGAEISIARGTGIGLLVLHDGTVRMGDFYVADGYGRQIMQSTDQRTGMSGEPDEEGKFYLWAGYLSDGNYAFAVNNRQQTHTKYLYCHDDDAFYQGRTVTDVLKELSEGGGGTARHRMTMETPGLDSMNQNATLVSGTMTAVSRED